jgi:hypothetical protein
MVVLEDATSIYSNNVRFGSEADIRAAKSHVRFTPESVVAIGRWSAREKTIIEARQAECSRS